VQAICFRLLDMWPEAIELYEEMKEGCRLRSNLKFVNQTTCLLLLPLEKNREKIEDALENF
jgi:hypothetical protein